MDNKIPFKKQNLDALPTTDRRYHIQDPKTPFLHLRVYENTGRKVYILIRAVKGKNQKIIVGKYDCLTIEQARKKARELNANIELGGNPQQERLNERKALTFKELYGLYYDLYATKHTKGAEANKRTMEVHVFPTLERLKANEITSQQIQKLHTKIGEKKSRYSTKEVEKKSYGTANRVMAIVSAVFNFGSKEKYTNGNNPCTGLKKYKSQSRDRFLSLGELKSFMDALKSEDELFSDLFKILLFTGGRKSNVLSMKWEDIDFYLKRWRIPESQTKNSDVNIIVLSQDCIEILERRLNNNNCFPIPSKFVFPTESKKGHLVDPKKAFARIKQRMNVHDIRVHDLRRTLGSYMAITGASIPIIGKALNHKNQTSTAIYARLSQDPVFEAVKVATELMTMQIEQVW